MWCMQEEGPVLGWEGAIMSTFSNEAADWEGDGYGPLLATPSVSLLLLTWLQLPLLLRNWADMKL